MGLLADLGASSPLVAAPMAGGPTTPGFVVAVGRAGVLGFLAGGYQTPEQLATDVAAVRAAGTPFAVNLFSPNPLPVDPAAFRRHAAALQGEADRYGLDLAGAPIVEDDDHWTAKLDVLLAAPVALVTCTFGLPDPGAARALQAVGTLVGQTVTSVDEARRAADVGVDLLVVQSAAAGGHLGTLTPGAPPPARPLADLVRSTIAAADLPVLAAGGVAGPADVAAALDAGAEGVAVGTALLLADEAGTSEVHRAALSDPARTQTVQTRAFTGRPARGLRNRMTDQHEATAPLGYPAIHHLTRPLRRAAAAAGDPELVNLWAGTGHASARPGPAADLLADLTP